MHGLLKQIAVDALAETWCSEDRAKSVEVKHHVIDDIYWTQQVLPPEQNMACKTSFQNYISKYVDNATLRKCKVWSIPSVSEQWCVNTRLE